jgi:23S rRNA (uracil1939-C5)-methyltransferase
MSRKPIVRREIEMRVSDLSSEGFGRGQINAREIRLRNALPGELVQGLVRKRKRRIDHGDALTIVEPSPDRQTPICGVAHRCGGCTFQHASARFELNWKEDQLRKALERSGVIAQRWQPPVAGPQHGYRHKARLGVRQVGGQIYLGFREAFSGRVVDMRTCTILTSRLADLIGPLRQRLGELSIAGRIPQIEIAAGDSTVAMVVRNLEALADRDHDVLRAFACDQRVEVFLQPAGPDSVVWVTGRGEALGYSNPDFGLQFAFEPLDFVQVNRVMNRHLVRKAVLELVDSTQVLDLFCGLGNFSLALARTGKSVIGLESSETAVVRARLNARRNGLQERTAFAAVDLYGTPLQASINSQACDAILLDPPRLGAGPQLRTWLQAGVQTVVYVSCNPESFARDAIVLGDAGLRLDEVGIYDMFPQTTHIETVGVFRRR